MLKKTTIQVQNGDTLYDQKELLHQDTYLNIENFDTTKQIDGNQVTDKYLGDSTNYKHLKKKINIIKHL